jgi:hypothetical protein
MAHPLVHPRLMTRLGLLIFLVYINVQMHEDQDVSRHARRKDTLSAEDLGILLQWHWKYGTSTFHKTSAGECK